MRAPSFARSLAGRLARVGRGLRLAVVERRDPIRAKRMAELAYWRERAAEETVLANDHYGWFFTEHFGLDPGFYRNRAVLDLGCGPRGSLEWARLAGLRVGLDPLAAEYRPLGTGRHAMAYVAASSEAIPFADGALDVVSSFNSLDHVDDLDGTLAEVGRVLRPGGEFLLLVEVNHRPTVLEPLTLDWSVTRRSAPLLEPVEVRRFRRLKSGLYGSVRAAIPYDDGGEGRSPGILSARFRRTRAADG